VKPSNDRTEAGKAVTPLRRARFRIDRLEERIAPKGWGKGGKPVPSKGGSRCDDSLS
jgi:hypothetical protein